MARRPRSWEDFVDRFLGLVIHVINHTAQSRSIRIGAEDREDLVAEVFLAIINDDFALLRRFRGESSLATYLTVVARRVVVRELLKRKATSTLSEAAKESLADEQPSVEERIGNLDEVERLLDELQGAEADVIRLYHLEGKSYREISESTGVAENSIGPMLSRARSKLRRSADTAAG